MHEAGLDPECFLAEPLPDERVRSLTRRLLREADRLYRRSEAGISALPLTARPGIFAARHVYAGIGGAIERNGYDTISYRARTYKRQKLGWLMLATLRTGATLALPQSAVLHAQPLDECRFLVDAAARHRPAAGWSGRTGALLAALAELETRDRDARQTARAG